MTDINLSGHFRTDLKCRKVNTTIPLCLKLKTPICACSTAATWKLDNSTIGFLELEFMTKMGNSRIIRSYKAEEVDYFYLNKSSSFVSHIPENVCEYPKIVVLNLSKNRLATLIDFGCITRLTYLDLSYNRISQIKKSHFEGLSYLKDLILSHNKISYIQPETFNHNSLGLINLDVSHNLLTVIDISNILLPKTFCKFSFEANGIFGFRNDGLDPVTGSEDFNDGGIVELSSNRVQRFPHPTSLGIEKGFDFYGKIMFKRFVFILKDNPLACDCFLEEFLRNAKSALERFQMSVIYSCHSPLRWRGTSIVEEFIKQGNFSQLTCNLPNSCPKHCSCVFQSSNDIIIIECRSSYNESFLPVINLTDMTESIRSHARYQNATLSLRFSNGNIQELNQQPYLNETSYINLSLNSISRIEYAAIESLKTSSAELDLTGNNAILNLPVKMKDLNPQHVHLRNTILLCDCKLMSWFPDWLENNFVKADVLNITCNINGRAIPFVQVTSSDLNCEEEDLYYFLACLLGSLIMIGLLLYFLQVKYGLPLFVYYKSIVQKTGNTQQWLKYDVYISCDENNEEILSYVIREFLPMLRACKLKPFFLAQDAAVGDVTEESIIHSLSASRIFVFFLTNSNINEQGSTFFKEWKYAWNKYLFSKVHDIVLINFDLLRFSKIKDRRMKAIKAAGHVVNFSDVDFKIKLIKLLDKQSQALPQKNDYNSKVNFNLFSLHKRTS